MLYYRSLELVAVYNNSLATYILALQLIVAYCMMIFFEKRIRTMCNVQSHNIK